MHNQFLKSNLHVLEYIQCSELPNSFGHIMCATNTETSQLIVVFWNGLLCAP